MLVDMDNLATRYNSLSLLKMKMLTEAAVQRFLRLYERSFQLMKGPFRTVEANNGMDNMTVNELVDSFTLGTYGQQVTQLHAIMTLIALAGRGQSVNGGNYQIFENMIKASSAKLKMNQTVTKIIKNMEDGKWTVTTAESSNKYDIVILATPPHQSNITLINIRDEITKVDYVQQHITLFTTNATHLGSSYMKMATPISFFVTRHLERQNTTKNLKLDVEVMSMSKLLYPTKEHLVKLSSPTYLNDAKLAKIFDGKANISWVYRKMWHAYPRAPPKNDANFPPINPDKGFYYANAFESFISTMETQCLAAHNIIRLLLADYGYDEKAATLADNYWIDTKSH
ncbi:unnamed protein product [Rotaria sordida]|uniref:Prenylcysteine lyase domain-containing protein n=2 Tax=Rotaria sordida TaxID=392033 RepID=A0A814HLS8_9BILA|nr:unnamed protein product [Rotaria sordida]CAF1104908.1 unnamed protein product [Rotaria sordida]